MKEKRSVSTWIILGPLLLLSGGVIGYMVVIALYILVSAINVVGNL